MYHAAEFSVAHREVPARTIEADIAEGLIDEVRRRPRDERPTGRPDAGRYQQRPDHDREKGRTPHFSSLAVSFGTRGAAV
jgi:hypothetical protein